MSPETLNLWINIFGYGAAICMVFGYLPQAIDTMRTRNTEGIALPTFLMMGLGSFFFVAQGICMDNLPLIITNCVTGFSSVVITCIKISNDCKKRRSKKI